MARLAAVLLAALALVLGACGGDESSSGSTARDQAGTTDGATATAPRDGGSKSGDGDIPKLSPDNSEPVPEGSAALDERTGKPPRYDRANPIPKAQLKAIERPIYEQSRYLCKRLGVDGMRREYRIDSSDPADVARAVAARTYQRETRAAVFSGCLAGLRSGD